MENVTDALIMAGSVLLLIIALTVTISSLSNLRTQTQDLLSNRDQLLATTDDELGGYINYLQSGSEERRTVGIETVISSIRRMWREDYTVYIQTKNIIDVPKDLKVEIEEDGTTKNYIKLSLGGRGHEYEYDKTVTGMIYKELRDATFKEYIGIYQNKTSEGVSDANKATYKIITYIQE